MSVPGREAIDDYSKESRSRTAAPGHLGAPATAALGLGIAGAVLAFVATFSTVIEIRVLTVTPASFDGMDRYGPALLLLGVFALLMVAGAWRGARPAMAALALAGVAVLLIAVLVDVPHLNDKGVWPLSDQYEDAAASAGIGFYFETAAGVLMLLGGVLALLLAPRGRGAAPQTASRSGAAEQPEDRTRREEPPAPPPAPAEDPMAPRAQRLTQPQPPRKRRLGGIVGRRRGRG
jgi:hypothetical protein